jgi:hypothetical protein
LAFDVNFQNTDVCGSNSKKCCCIKKSDKFWVLTGENSMACIQVDFVQAEKIQFLYYIANIKTNAVLRFRQLVPFCFLFELWSQSAPSSAKKGSYKKVSFKKSHFTF